METLLTIQELKHLATEIRKDTLRSITAAGSVNDRKIWFCSGDTVRMCDIACTAPDVTPDKNNNLSPV